MGADADIVEGKERKSTEEGCMKTSVRQFGCKKFIQSGSDEVVEDRNCWIERKTIQSGERLHKTLQT